MIQCPNCKEQIADDSAHCGFCGHQLKGGASKTMFGMAPVSADDIEGVKAATEAAKAAAEEGKSLGGIPKPSVPRPSGSDGGSKPTLPKPSGLNLPKPSATPAAPSGPGGSSLPAPGAAPADTEPTAAADAGVPPDEAKTEMMAPVPSHPAPEDVGDTAPATPAAMPPTDIPGDDVIRPAPSPTPMWGEQAPGNAPASDDSWGDSGTPEVASDGSWGDSGTPEVASDGSWGDSSGQATAEAGGPSAWGDESSLPQTTPDAPMAAGGGGGGFPPDKSKKDEQQKMILYIAGGVGGLMFFCCVLSIILRFVVG